MAKIRRKSYRLSIDVDPEEHRKIKMASAIYDETISSYVLKAVREHLEQDLEHQGLLAMSRDTDPVLVELWDNEKDSIYDKL